jgi:hypothetical protein
MDTAKSFEQDARYSQDGDRPGFLGASTISGSRLGTMNPGGRHFHATASWTAAALCRFRWLLESNKALEGWRSPKPGGPLFGSWKASTAHNPRMGTLNRN